MTSFTSESKLSAVKETADNEPFLRPDIELEIEWERWIYYRIGA